MATSNTREAQSAESSDTKLMVEQGYDQIAQLYLAWTSSRPSPRLTYLQKLLAVLPDAANVLELGCGAGVPVTKTLMQHNARVTGVDISAAQVALAKANVPAANFVKADMMALQFERGAFDAVVGMYSLIHVPRAEQGVLLARIAEWLKPGGHLLVNLTALDMLESVERDWLNGGADMFWSGYDAATNRDLVQRAGFTLVESDVVAEEELHEVRFLWVLARKSGIA